MTSSILFLPASSRSHVNSAMYVAGLLKNSYKTYLAVTSDELENAVISAGFPAMRISAWRVAAGMEAQYVQEKFNRPDKWETLKAVYHDALFHLREQELCGLVDSVKPTAIFVDILNSTDLLILCPRYPHIRLLYLNPMLSTYRVNGFPALHEGEWQKPQQQTSETQRGIPFSKILKDPIGLMIRKSERRQFERLTAYKDFSQKHPLATDLTQVLLFENIPEILLAPLELEVSPGVRKPNQHYLGLCIQNAANELHDDEEVEMHFTRIVQQLRGNGPLVFYALEKSFEGTEEALLQFLEKLLEAFRLLPGMNAVFSLDEKWVEMLRNSCQIPDNVLIFSGLPASLINQADLFINHGNLSSINLGIYQEVPMLVYPHGAPFDQVGNGLKVEYFGLGLRGDFGNDRAEDIVAKIKTLLSSEQYLKSISLFRKRVLEKYKEDRVRNILFRLLNTPASCT